VISLLHTTITFFILLLDFKSISEVVVLSFTLSLFTCEDHADREGGRAEGRDRRCVRDMCKPLPTPQRRKERERGEKERVTLTSREHTDGIYSSGLYFLLM
jgi:hypothetical protein